MIFIDANIFLAYANENDVHHGKALQIFNAIESGVYGPPFTSDYVFNEVVGVTFRKQGKKEAIILGNHILNTIFMLHMDEHLLKEAWKLFATTNFTFNLVDCSNLVLMNLAKAESIVTFDKEFSKIGTINVIA